MSVTAEKGILTDSLLRLSPPAFFHDIWIEFVRRNSPVPPDLITELNQAAEHLITNNNLENACQIWLICAFLESQLGDNKNALSYVEKTAEFAQINRLPKIQGWANWGAGSLYAQQGNWGQAINYLQRLRQLLDKQGDWILANIIYILETNLNQEVSTTQVPLCHPETEPQLDIILDHFLCWGTTNLTPKPQTSSVNNQSFFRRLWGTITEIFEEKFELAKPISKTPRLASSKLSNDKVQSLPDSTKPKSSILTIVEDKSDSSNEMERLQNQKLEQTQMLTESQSSLSQITVNQPERGPYFEPEDNAPSLIIYCLGSFRVYQNENLVEQWPSGKGKLIFKYLLLHRQHPIAKEVLMELFWPDSNPDAARNNLNVAIYGLRQALRNGYEEFSHILYQDDHYFLNPELKIWIDYEIFLELWQSARRKAKITSWKQAVGDYHAAESLYQGELFAEDRYEEWIMPHRQHLQDTYLSLLEQLSHYYFKNEGYITCIEACRNILEVDPCRESAHRRLMRCYCRQGQYYLGMRQYHQCEEALQNELEVSPSPETTKLYIQIRRHESI